MIHLNSTNWFQMRQGLGKMNSEISKTEQINCHSRITATSSTHGDQVSICFLLIRMSGCPIG